MELPDTANPEMETILDMFESHVRKTPECLAVTENGNQITYGQLNNRAEFIARKIRFVSGNNPFVAVLLPQGIDFISCLYGIFKSSHTVCPIDIGNSKMQISYILEQLNNPLIITSKELLVKIPDYGGQVMATSELELNNDILLQETKIVQQEKEENKLAFIIFTSGSTGKPKGVKISHRIISSVTQSSWSRIEITASDRSVTYSSPAFVLSFSEYITMLARGGSVFVPPIELRQDLDKLHEFINHHKITVLSMPTSAAVKIMNRDMPSLRWLRLGGEKLTVPIEGSRTFRMLYVYGSTETFAIAFRTSFEGSGIPTNGPLAQGVSIWFLDENMEQVGKGQVGEICVASHTVSEGYLNHPEINRERFVPNPFNPGQILYRTGDLGYMNSSGELVVTGRADFQVKIMGHRIELGQVEFALTQHPDIKLAAVILRENKNGAKTIGAFCVPQPGKTVPELYSLYKFLVDHLPRYAFPSQVTELTAIPMTTSGKFDRQALKAIKVEHVVDPLATETERKIGAIWSEILKIPIEEIGRSDSFFSLGGNSLQLALVVTKLQNGPWFLNVRINHLIQVPRLDEFGALVDKCKEGNFDLSKFVQNDTQVPDFATDLQLDSNFPEVITDFPSGEHNILLTGATGYVGANFLKVLLERTTDAHRVHCLIRAGSGADAQARLGKILTKFGIEINPSLLMRVVYLAGDVSKYEFGMSSAQYKDLTETIDIVYHIAAEVHFLKTYAELRNSNVGGTRRMLNFSTQNKVKFLHFISTFGTIGAASEDDLILELPDPLFKINEEASRDMGYSQTKRVAEKLVWAAIQRGFPAIIYRLGEIGCHSKLNVVNRDDFLARLFLTCAETGFYPQMGDKKLPYGSVDFTCEALVCIAAQGKKWQGKCFHLFENQISYLDGFQQLKNCVGLEGKAWIDKIAEIIEVETNPTKQEEFSILLQLMQNATGSSVLNKKFSNSNLKLALDGHDVGFNPQQDWSRFLKVLLNLEREN